MEEEFVNKKRARSEQSNPQEQLQGTSSKLQKPSSSSDDVKPVKLSEQEQLELEFDTPIIKKIDESSKKYSEIPADVTKFFKNLERLKKNKYPTLEEVQLKYPRIHDKQMIAMQFLKLVSKFRYDGTFNTLEAYENLGEKYKNAKPDSVRMEYIKKPIKFDILTGKSILNKHKLMPFNPTHLYFKGYDISRAVDKNDIRVDAHLKYHIANDFLKRKFEEAVGKKYWNNYPIENVTDANDMTYSERYENLRLLEKRLYDDK